MKKNLVSLFLIVTVIIYIFTYFCTNPGFASQKTGNLGKSQSEAAGIEAAKSIKETQAYVENLLKEIADLTKKMQKAEADKNMPLLRTLADSLAQKLTDHANILLAGGHLNSAGAKYFSAVQLDQNNYRALSGLGYVLLQQGMFEQAAITLAKAIQAYPEKLNKNDKTSNYMAHNNLGICYIELARRDIDVKQKLLYSKASRTLKQAIKIDENHHFAYFNLARVYEGRKAYSMAVDNYVAAINKNPKDNEAYIAAARLYKDELKKSDKAMQIIEKAVKNVPNASAIHSFKADLLMDKKSFSKTPPLHGPSIPLKK
jgi:tetratricopeptide (TPR) repeat protein